MDYNSFFLFFYSSYYVCRFLGTFIFSLFPPPRNTLNYSRLEWVFVCRSCVACVSLIKEQVPYHTMLLLSY